MARVIDGKVKRLVGDRRVRTAALIGHTFGVDPVQVLDEPSTFKALVRVAAYNIVQNETAKARKGK